MNNDDDSFDSYEILDADEPLPSVSKTTVPTLRSPSAGAVVPYDNTAHLPAVVPTSLGDIEAFIRAANAAPMLTAEQERSLAIDLRDNGNLEAAQQLILSHLRLVVSVARGYLGYGLPHADLIQEGNIGLMKAIKHYDPDHGVRLMTFAVHWIRSEIQDYVIKNWRLVKLATTKNQRKLFFNLRKMKDSDKALTTKQTNAIALTLNVKPEEVREMEMRMNGGDTSIDGGYDDDRDDAAAGKIAPIDWLSRESDTPVEVLAERDKTKLENTGLRGAMEELDERSRRVIEARWLNEDSDGNSSPLTLQELAAEMGVSAERVRQIEKKALAKMREALMDQKDSLED